MIAKPRSFYNLIEAFQKKALSFPRILFVLFFLLCTTGCSASNIKQFDNTEQTTIYVVGHGWHTGIVVQSKDFSLSNSEILQKYKKYNYIEISWGDMDFFQSNKLSVPIALKAAFLPTSSVLHIVGFNHKVQTFFSESTVVTLATSMSNLESMLTFVERSFYHDKEQKLVNLGPGLYGDSNFYKAREKYYLPKTCNTWTAQALSQAGYSISPFHAIRAKTLIKTIKKFDITSQ